MCSLCSLLPSLGPAPALSPSPLRVAVVVEPLGTSPSRLTPSCLPAVLVVLPCGAEAPASARAVRRMGLVAGRVALL